MWVSTVREGNVDQWFILVIHLSLYISPYITCVLLPIHPLRERERERERERARERALERALERERDRQTDTGRQTDRAGEITYHMQNDSVTNICTTSLTEPPIVGTSMSEYLRLCSQCNTCKHKLFQKLFCFIKKTIQTRTIWKQIRKLIKYPSLPVLFYYCHYFITPQVGHKQIKQGCQFVRAGFCVNRGNNDIATHSLAELQSCVLATLYANHIAHRSTGRMHNSSHM